MHTKYALPRHGNYKFPTAIINEMLFQKNTKKPKKRQFGFGSLHFYTKLLPNCGQYYRHYTRMLQFYLVHFLDVLEALWLNQVLSTAETPRSNSSAKPKKSEVTYEHSSYKSYTRRAHFLDETRDTHTHTHADGC